MRIPDHLTCLLRNLYAGQEVIVRNEHGTMDWFQIGKGVHQDYILSSYLFNFYAEYIMRNAGLEEAQAGIKIAGRHINIRGWDGWMASLIDGRESEWTPGVGDGLGGLACCDSWGRKESDTTERLNWTELMLSTCISSVKLLFMPFALISTGALLFFSLFPKSAFHFHLLIHTFNKYYYWFLLWEVPI